MYTYQPTNNRLGSFEGNFGVNPFTTAWRYYTGQPTETNEEFAERAREEGLVPGAEEQERLRAAAAVRQEQYTQQQERERLRDEALDTLSKLKAEEKEASGTKKKVLIAVGGVLLLAGGWYAAVKLKSASQ